MSEWDVKIEGREGRTKVEEAHGADVFDVAVASLDEEI